MANFYAQQGPIAVFLRKKMIATLRTKSVTAAHSEIVGADDESHQRDNPEGNRHPGNGHDKLSIRQTRQETRAATKLETTSSIGGGFFFVLSLSSSQRNGHPRESGLARILSFGFNCRKFSKKTPEKDKIISL
jgi:hypothetical protein